ncbi:hypothetical protein NL676_035314 [Syzygium grande]|nr:hypothetical protein NL676_035314 [Syzygium grande]
MQSEGIIYRVDRIRTVACGGASSGAEAVPVMEKTVGLSWASGEAVLCVSPAWGLFALSFSTSIFGAVW